MKGYKHSDEARKKISLGRLKRKATLGYLNSPETREKMRQIGTGHVVLDETKAKISAFQKGRSRSQETRRKISSSMKGRIHKPQQGFQRGHSFLGGEETRRKMSEARKGEKHHNWKGGVTPINTKVRHSFEYKLWRTAVFERDNYTCIWCGVRNGNGTTIVFNADHIKPFALYPELRFAIDNGRTLCVPCHQTTDTYGSKSHKKS